MTDESTDPTAESQEERGEEAVQPTGRKLRARTIRFVAVFVVLVLTFLTGYRYAVDTDANMWYLFQVSRSTAWLLGVVGHSAELEPQRFSGIGQSKRVQLARWRSGDELSNTAAPDVEEGALTAWESWQYRAYSTLRGGGTLQEYGPTVYFLARQGTASRRLDLKESLTEAKAVEKPDRGLVARIEDDLADLDAKEAAQEPGPALNEVRRNVVFSFQVVPDCGAIPSMSIFVAAVIAFPTLILYRLIGVVGGMAVLYAINIGRLATLAYLGAYDTASGGKWFRFAHEYVWQGIFIIFVVAVWMAWIELVVKARRI